MRIFLTGGTGFFGKSILSMMSRGKLPDCDLTILSRNPGAFFQVCPEFAQMPNVVFCQGDVRNFTFPEGKFDYVIHGGAPAQTMPEGVERDIILKGTERTLKFAEKCGASKYMFVSSGAVYGEMPEHLNCFPDTLPCHPIGEYALAKLEAEQMCLASGLFSVIPRCFAFVGPYLNRNIHFAIGNFIRDALEGKNILINGNGTPIRSYMYADDLAEWLFTLLEKAQANMTYNLGSNVPISISELAKTVRDVINPKVEVIVKGTDFADGKISRYVPDTSRCAALGLKMHYSLRDSIAKSAVTPYSTPCPPGNCSPSTDRTSGALT